MNVQELMQDIERRGLDIVEILQCAIDMHQMCIDDTQKLRNCVKDTTYRMDVCDGDLHVHIYCRSEIECDSVVEDLSTIAYCTLHRAQNHVHAVLYGSKDIYDCFHS